jgi:hypothetical protein
MQRPSNNRSFQTVQKALHDKRNEKLASNFGSAANKLIASGLDEAEPGSGLTIGKTIEFRST